MFFFLFQPKRTCFFFFRQTRSCSRTQQQRDTCSSTLTFPFHLALSQLFLRLGLARLGFTRGSRSRCCKEGVFSPLQVEFVLTKFTDPAGYLFRFFPIAATVPGMCSQTLDVPKFMLTLVFFQDFLATDWTRQQVQLVHFFCFERSGFCWQWPNTPATESSSAIGNLSAETAASICMRM